MITDPTHVSMMDRVVCAARGLAYVRKEPLTQEYFSCVLELVRALEALDRYTGLSFDTEAYIKDLMERQGRVRA